ATQTLGASAPSLYLMPSAAAGFNVLNNSKSREVVEDTARSFTLPPEWQSLTGTVAHFVHGCSIVQASVDHCVSYIFGVSDVFQWISIQNDQISQFSSFNGSDMVTHPDISSTIHGRSADCFQL